MFQKIYADSNLKIVNLSDITTIKLMFLCWPSRLFFRISQKGVCWNYFEHIFYYLLKNDNIYANVPITTLYLQIII